MSYPIYSIMGVGSFFYAKTCLPYFSKGYSLAFLILTIGPFMIIRMWDLTSGVTRSGSWKSYSSLRCTGASCSSAGWRSPCSV